MIIIYALSQSFTWQIYTVISMKPVFYQLYCPSLSPVLSRRADSTRRANLHRDQHEGVQVEKASDGGHIHSVVASASRAISVSCGACFVSVAVSMHMGVD